MLEAAKIAESAFHQEQWGFYSKTGCNWRVERSYIFLFACSCNGSSEAQDIFAGTDRTSCSQQ
jgi:hypothetical protein